ncbi:hypothetical protein SACE_0062 [Saccharopolyspora erythraea NRRL 2338]|uniref:Uncharacterized protein n=1 Tax=Saccharopolyspora erythraea (strain ATCC 11635 / DSM 40517 / JCM 4748 / NBRC 13426 / NCIMB 8594 / NRRL 2338) TaxID=405948 RepID=A4F5U1_SACEN|nr:hypothetical protein SACE_0062 [Saccharopolyspora erythraea NRRL 2338]
MTPALGWWWRPARVRICSRGLSRRARTTLSRLQRL